MHAQNPDRKIAEADHKVVVQQQHPVHKPDQKGPDEDKREQEQQIQVLLDVWSELVVLQDSPDVQNGASGLGNPGQPEGLSGVGAVEDNVDKDACGY